MKRTLVVTVLLATACSSSSSGGSDSGIVTAQSTADKVGCTNVVVEEAASHELFVADSAKCDLNGKSITINRYTDNAARDSWIKIATQFGVGRFVAFERGVVTSDDQTVADAVQKKVGGDVRTK